MTEKRKRGRPRKAEEDRRGITLKIRVTPYERELIWARAEESGKTLSEFARLRLMN